MKKEKEPEPIKGILDQFFRQLGTQKHSPQLQILEHWNSLVSDAAAQYCSPVLLRDAVLVVVVSNSSWLHHLSMQKQELLAAIQSIVGIETVSDIRFKIGEPRMV